MLKRFLCLALCVLLLPVAAATAETTFSMAGYDGEDSNHDWETNQFFARMQERTGISFTFQEYKSSSDWQKAKDQMFATGELPDVLFKASLTSEELIRYTDSGQLIDLKPLLEENAPHLWALLTENPDWMEAITLPNGKIGALPAIHSASTQDVLWINQTWLNNLGLDMPSDQESLKQVLIAFRDKDPNQNNKKDEIPLGFLGPWELKFLSSAFGVVANDYNIYLADDGTVHFWPDEDSFFELAAWLKELYAEGLLDPNGFYTSDVLRRSGQQVSRNLRRIFRPQSPEHRHLRSGNGLHDSGPAGLRRTADLSRSVRNADPRHLRHYVRLFRPRRAAPMGRYSLYGRGRNRSHAGQRGRYVYHQRGQPVAVEGRR